MTQSHPAQRRVFRPPSGAIGIVVAAVVALLLLGDAVVRGGWVQAMLLAPWVLLALWLAYVFLFASYVETDAAGSTVQNLLRRTRVPWGRVTDVDLRWQLIYTLDDGSLVKAFGGPVAGRPGRPSLRPDAAAGRSVPPALRDLQLIREQWETALSEGVPTGVGAGEIRHSWDIPSLAGLALIVIWAVSAVLISGTAA